MKDMNNNFFFSSVYIFVVKGGFALVLFLCSAYMKVIVNRLKFEEGKDREDERKERENLVKNKDESSNNTLNILMINDKKHKNKTSNKEFLLNFFHTHISLLFLPLTLSFLLQIISLYLYTFVKTTSEVMKRNPYLIFILIQTFSSISSLLPLLF